ncbi:MAG: threonine ammonia-lyase [Geminicoccaceae bacterium]
MSPPAAVDLGAIDEAAARIEGHVRRTPCRIASALSTMTGCTLALKFENLQETASFKDRGASNKLSQLTAEERKRGVIAMSAGNHAQGTAYHSQRLNIPATIVMPQFTPTMKVEKTRRYGAEIKLEGDSLETAALAARDIAAERKLVFIHPYDDPAIIAGQGTIAREMLDDVADLDTIIVPIGGGGLIAGIATAAKTLKPSIEIIGVEAALYPSMYRAIRGLPDEPGGATIAEGIAVKSPGVLTREIVERLVDDILLVDEAAIEGAILSLLEYEKSVVEGAGAAGLAAVQTHASRFRGRTVGLVICGGNIDSRLLSDVILRGLVRSERLIHLRLAVPDRPGSLAQATAIIAEHGGNVVEVAHRRAFSKSSVKHVDLDIVMETRGRDHARDIGLALTAAGLIVERLDQSGP